MPHPYFSLPVGHFHFSKSLGETFPATPARASDTGRYAWTLASASGWAGLLGFTFRASTLKMLFEALLGFAYENEQLALMHRND